MPTDILHTIGCVAVWAAFGSMLWVRKVLPEEQKTEIVVPVVFMSVAVACLTISRLLG